MHFIQRIVMALLASLMLAACSNHIEKDADPFENLQFSEDQSALELDPKLSNFGQPEPVIVCHRTLSPAAPFATLYLDPSEVEMHRLHGDIVPAPPEGCGSIVDTDIVPLPGGASEPDSVSTASPQATLVPTGIPPTVVAPPAATSVPTTAAAANQCAEGQTLADLLASERKYRQLAEALYQAGLLAALDDPAHTYVFFVPKHVDREIKHEELSDFILAHLVVLDHPIDDDALAAQGTMTTASGAPISVAVDDGDLMLNGNQEAEVLLTACNGIVYRIERPLTDDDSDAGAGQDQVAICHRTDGKDEYNAIMIAASAVESHQQHGDVYPVPDDGCPDGDDDHGNGRGDDDDD